MSLAHGPGGWGIYLAGWGALLLVWTLFESSIPMIAALVVFGLLFLYYGLSMARTNSHTPY
jgi:CHASE2 domain-containing sensor protein